MGHIIGIDLGTTYSAVAIPEEQTGPGFLTVPECPGCSLILDNLKRRSIPSVVAEDGRGAIVVGHPAKGRAGLRPEPITFSKRYMGEAKTYQLGKQGLLKPEEAGHPQRGLPCGSTPASTRAEAGQLMSFDMYLTAGNWNDVSFGNGKRRTVIACLPTSSTGKPVSYAPSPAST